VIIAIGRPCEELLAEHIEYIDALEQRNLSLVVDCFLRHFEKGTDS
jgi:DNA-binding GntR family transcriptional regulator